MRKVTKAMVAAVRRARWFTAALVAMKRAVGKPVSRAIVGGEHKADPGDQERDQQEQNQAHTASSFIGPGVTAKRPII